MTPSRTLSAPPFDYFGIPVTLDLRRIEEAVAVRYCQARPYQDRPYLRERWDEFLRRAAQLAQPRSGFPGFYEADPDRVAALVRACCEQHLGTLRERLLLWAGGGVLSPEHLAELLGLAEEAGFAADAAEPYLRGLMADRGVRVDETASIPMAAGGGSDTVPDLVVPGFEVLRPIGRGGMGTVLLARQLSLDRLVAVKVLSPRLAENPNFVARFEREAAALARLTHPHIVTIHERGRVGNHFYLVLEYVAGADGAPEDLRRRLSGGPLPPPDVRRLAMQAAQALAAAHRLGIVHRDIKPSNILLDAQGHAKVTDFGIAAIDGGASQLTGASETIGTPDYMAPEQRRAAAAVDHRADVYALGTVLYEMLTGVLPVGAYRPPSQVVSGLNPGWDRLINRALQPEPAQRYTGMEELLADLSALSDQGPAHCPRCQQPSVGEEPFCGACGAVLRVRCPRCDLDFAAGVRFCSRCRLDLEALQRFRSQIETGRSVLASARRQAPAAQRWTDAESAWRTFGQALESFPDDTEARTLASEARALTRQLLWEAAHALIGAGHLGPAVPLLQRLQQEPEEAGGASERLQAIVQRRQDVLASARAEADRGQWDRAGNLLSSVRMAFPDDAEIAARLADCAARAERVRQAQQRIGLLQKEKRQVALLRLLNELAQQQLNLNWLAGATEACRKKLLWANEFLKEAERALAEGRRHEALAHADRVLAHVTDHPGALTLRGRVSAQDESRCRWTTLYNEAAQSQRWFLAYLALQQFGMGSAESSAAESARAALRARMARADDFRRFLVWSLLSAVLLVLTGWVVQILDVTILQSLPERLFDLQVLSANEVRAGLSLAALVSISFTALLALLACFGRRFPLVPAVAFLAVLVFGILLAALFWSALVNLLQPGRSTAVGIVLRLTVGLFLATFAGLLLGFLAMLPASKLAPLPTGWFAPPDRAALGAGVAALWLAVAALLLPEPFPAIVLSVLLCFGLLTLVGDFRRKLAYLMLPAALAGGGWRWIALDTSWAPPEWLIPTTVGGFFAGAGFVLSWRRRRPVVFVRSAFLAGVGVASPYLFAPHFFSSALVCAWIFLHGMLLRSCFSEHERRLHVLDRLRLWRGPGRRLRRG